jgi:alpha-tubulin suppressor-like RCC1 family protein
MGDNSWGQLANSRIGNQATPIQVASDVVAIAAGASHSLFTRSDGSLWTMGADLYGQLGAGEAIIRSQPMQVATGVMAASVGLQHGFYVDDRGGLWGMGDNSSGRAGLGAVPFSSFPMLATTGVVSVSCGYYHTLFLKTDGTAWAMGWVGNGALGGGTSAVQVMQSVAAVSAGATHSLFLKSDGTLWASGTNARGQLGDTSTTDRMSPVQVANQVEAMAGGGDHSLFLKKDGTLWAMGANSEGQLGDSTTVDRREPVMVSSNVQAVAAGQGHSLFLKRDGSVWAMGRNGSGQLGDGTNTQRNSPVPIGADVVKIAAGNNHSLWLKSDKTLWAVGHNYYGQLGDGSRTFRSRAVLTASNVVDMAAGGNNSSFVVSSDWRLPSAVPQITAQPVGQNLTVGQNVTLSAVASPPGVAFQWRKNGVMINAGTNATLALNGISPSDAGSYSVMVSNAGGGTVSSDVAVLTILPATDPGRLVNLSILTNVNASSPSFTVGTVVGGAGTSGSKALLVRAAGPSLSPLGVSGVLADPVVDLYSGQTVLASNDNWGGTLALTSVFSQVGAFAFSSASSKDAAVFSAAMPAGGYTVKVSGSGGTTGAVIAEVYDATPAGWFNATTPRLVNVSVLKKVNADEILTAGFVIGGANAKQVLIRAVGQTLSLAPFNVTGVMADPKLELFSGQTLVTSNNDWGGDNGLASAFTGVGAFALSSAASKDAALLVTLQPGNYTAQVTGANGSAGLVLVEVYEVP